MKKLAIVGTHPDTRDQAPWNDPEFNIWVFNEAANASWCRRWDVCFQMHKPEVYRGENYKDPHHWEWLRKDHGKPIVMQAYDPDVPDCWVYPVENVIAELRQKYLTSTVCYALALVALDRSYQQVDIYGVELSSNTEYGAQAECFRFWVGYLMGAGITVNLHSGQALFRAPLYGYDGASTISAEHFEQRVQVLEAQWQAAEKNVKGVKATIEGIIKKKDCGKLPDAVTAYEHAATLSGSYAGALAEAQRYAKAGKPTDRQEFEKRSALAQRGDGDFIGGEQTRVLMYHMGGMVDYMWNVWMHSDNPQAIIQLTGFITQLGQLAYDTGAREGMFSENMSYLKLYDELTRANGGVK